MDRIAAARARLDHGLSVARQAKEAGPPCHDCRFRTLLSNCGNPAYAEPTFKPHSGAYEESFSTPVAKARDQDGLCGPEALLFEPIGAPVVVVKSAYLVAKRALYSVVLALFAFTLFAMITGYGLG